MPTKWPSNEEQLFDSHFWANPADWPRDPPGYVFLGRAFDEIGRAAHAERWIYAEPAEPEEPPDDCDDAEWDAYERADEQYEKAREQAKADFQNMRECLARMIAEQCELGNLVTAVRPKRGGEMTELGRHHWNIDDLRRRFFGCGMSVDHPFADHRVSRNDCWIYVTQASLGQYLSGLRVIGAAQPGEAQVIERSDNLVESEPSATERAHRLAATIEAIIAIWKDPPMGIMASQRDGKINAWLTKHDKTTVSAATIKRALNQLRSSRAKC
jgi:hypothetical protein